jgi:hypothetical protein
MCKLPKWVPLALTLVLNSNTFMQLSIWHIIICLVDFIHIQNCAVPLHYHLIWFTYSVSISVIVNPIYRCSNPKLWMHCWLSLFSYLTSNEKTLHLPHYGFLNIGQLIIIFTHCNELLVWFSANTFVFLVFSQQNNQSITLNHKWEHIMLFKPSVLFHLTQSESPFLPWSQRPLVLFL